MKNYKLLTILEDVISNELKEIDPRAAADAKAVFSRLGKTTGKNITDDIFNTMKRGLGGKSGEPIMVFGKMENGKFVNSNSPLAVTSGDDILNALKNGAIDAENLARVNKGILKSSVPVSPATLKSIVSDVVLETNFIQRYGKVYTKNGKEAATKLLRENGYSQNAIDEMFLAIEKIPNYGKDIAKIEKEAGKLKNKIKQKDEIIAANNKEIAELRARVNTNISQGGAVQVLENTSKEAGEFKPIIDANKNTIKEMSKTAFEKFKRIGKRLGGKWAVVTGLVTVAGGALLLSRLFGGTTRPDKTNTIFPKCITDLLDDDGATVTTTPSGDPVVIVKKTGNSEYDQIGGLMFYTNGRVFSGNKSKRGTWKCKGGEVAVTEMVNEQTEGEIDTDVNTMIDLLDFPVSGQNLQDAVALLKKYSTSSKGKEFLDLYKDSGLGGGDLKKSLDYVYTSEPASVRAKRTMYGLISQIEGGIGVSDGNKNTGVGNIDIVWDSETTPDDSNTTPPPPRRTRYIDCNQKPLPHEFGCKSEQIKKAQSCVGVKSDGYFGPNTKAAIEAKGIDLSNGITQNVIDTLCGGNEENKPERIKLEPLAPIKRDITQVPVNIDNLKLPNIKPLESTPAQFYNALRDNGNIVGEDGNNRIKYKGPDLDETQLGRLDSALSDMGYTRIKQLEDMKRYGSKYVWLKQ